MLEIVHLVWLKSHKNAAVHRLFELWNATRQPRARHLLVTGLVGGRRAVEGIVAMSDAALFLAQAACTRGTGIRTSARFPAVRS